MPQSFFNHIKDVPMDFHKLVLDARTCRRFDEKKPVSYEQLLALVDAARLVPSGKNAQPLRYTIASSADKTNAIFPNLVWAAALKDWNGPAAGERPTGYIAVGTDVAVNENPQVDLGIAIQTMQLMATHMGLGCCILASIKVKEVHNLVEFPENIKLLVVLAFGSPTEVRDVVPVSESGSTTYYRTPDMVHHVPKHALDTVLLKSFK